MMAPLNFSTPPSKPKIGFSIDSIVGEDSSPQKQRPAPSSSMAASPPPRSPRSPGSPRSPPARRRPGWSPPPPPAGVPTRPRSPLRSRSPLWPRSPLHSPKAAELEGVKLAAFQQQLQQLQLQRLHAPEPLHPALRPGLHALSVPHPLAGLPRPAATPAGQPLPPAFGPAALGMGALPPQTEYPLLPWLYSRQGRIFPSRFPGPDFPAFLLQPFRKPKRIRTAFSPSQLLKLEHAFENNHYVVGQERKQLAQSLNLSETQVKVWFQNRRTKHKRVQEEEGTTPAKSPGAAGDAEPAEEHADSLLTYEESDDDTIDVDEENPPTQVPLSHSHPQ